MRMAYSIEPTPVIESSGLNHQRVILPVANRVSEPGRVRVFRQLAPIHVDLPVTTSATLVKNCDDRIGLDDPVRGVQHFRGSAGQTVRDGIVPPEILEALHEHGFCSWPEDVLLFRILYEVK